MDQPDWLDDGTLMLPDITSPVARRVLSTVFYKISEPMTGSPDKPEVAYGDDETVLLRNELRRRLHNSGLARSIAAGPDTMPILFDYLPRWQQLLTDSRPPQTAEQLAVHVLLNLDWYVDRPKPASLIASAHWKSVILLAFSLSAFILFIFGQPTAGLAMLLISILFFLSPFFNRESTILNSESIKQSEFYLYLRESYGEGWHAEDIDNLQIPGQPPGTSQAELDS